jgi:magnesium transporter
VIRVWRYRDGVDQPEIIEVASLPATAPGTLVWVDCDRPTDDDLAAIGAKLSLNHLVVEDLQHGEQRTKLERYTDHFHIAVHDCQIEGDLSAARAAADLVTREIDVVFAEGWLLSVCQPSSGPDGTPFPIELAKHNFERQRHGAGATDEGFLLWSLLDIVVDRYFQVGDAIDDRLDALQEVVLEDRIDRLRRHERPRELFDLSKVLLRFRRAGFPLRDVTSQLLRREYPDISDAAILHFQDLYDHVLRIGDLAESQRDVLTGLREADLAVTSNQMSLVQQRIAAWGAILLVATLVTGFLGMNFRDAPDMSWGEGFLVVTGMVAVLSVPLYLYFRRKKWL